MAAPGRVLVLLLSLVVGALPLAGQVQAATSCHQINARGVGQDLGDGTTTARILGGGLLHGTTVGDFDPAEFRIPRLLEQSGSRGR